MPSKVRVGNGFDFHKLKSGTGLPIGGVFIKCGFGVIAHSDGDVLLHTIVDAILGGLSLGDIGTLFPPEDNTWQNANSTIFLQKALELMQGSGYEISNIDCTMICEKPKILQHRQEIITNLHKLMNMPKEDISLKATTTEKMGFLGRGEGIGCFVTVCLVK